MAGTKYGAALFRIQRNKREFVNFLNVRVVGKFSTLRGIRFELNYNDFITTYVEYLIWFCYFYCLQ